MMCAFSPLATIQTGASERKDSILNIHDFGKKPSGRDEVFSGSENG